MALTKVGKEGITGISNSSDANAITIDSSEKVGIGDTSPLGNKVHIRTAGSATSVNGDAGLVLESDDSTRCDLQFMGPDGAFQSIYFGDVSDDNRGIIAYSHSGNNMRFTVDASERMRLTSDGLTFNGDTAAANALDDYEEGTWTPAIYYQNSDDQTNSNNDTQTGFYVKVGTAVTAVCYLKWDATNSRANDNIGVSGLPFTASTVSGQSEVRYTAPVSYSHTSYPQGDSQVMGVVVPGQTLASFITANGSGNLGDEFGQNNNMEVRFTLQYVVN